ncbi:hypothetical protein [Antarcticirhabdus aurantiaca]|uniref:Uncharacterized protein n=1 Tax=Antarcticirhabdus aurantiaca TaxID=2606717 RepID=A0ACD4NMR9_9HYPH|nr:hypothetical protein [Antarcticirhabdus aurantiaca]WAJ27916.1 hypothetical protein OXU80_24250 [Jeongeuplla avenae]
MGKLLRLFGIADKNVDRFGYWEPALRWLWALAGGSAVMSALGAFWEAVSSQGWAAVLIFGIFSACGLALVVAAAAFLFAMAYRKMKPVTGGPSSPPGGTLAPVTVKSGLMGVATGKISDPPDLVGDRLHVGLVRVDTRDLLDRRELEFYIHSFNGSGASILVREVTGRIEVNVGSNPTKLTTTIMSAWLVDNPSLNKIEPYKAFYLSARCRVGEDIVAAFEELHGDNSISFILEELDISVQSIRFPDQKVRLPLWDGVTVSRADNFLYSNQIVMLRPVAIKPRAS